MQNDPLVLLQQMDVVLQPRATCRHDPNAVPLGGILGELRKPKLNDSALSSFTVLGGRSNALSVDLDLDLAPVDPRTTD